MNSAMQLTVVSKLQEINWPFLLLLKTQNKKIITNNEICFKVSALRR